MHVSLISDEKVEDLTQGKDYTVNDRQVTLAAPTGLKIKIYRVTTTKPLVGWADASVLRAADMTVQSTQLLHLAEETSDLAQDGGLSKDTADNIWDARYNKIKNLLDPTDPGDAVTLRYITQNESDLINQLKNTGAAQNASIVSTGDNQNARLVSTGDAQNKRLTDTGDTQNNRLSSTGDSYVNTMTSLKNTATDKATEATNQAALAKKWAVSETSPDGASDSKSSKTWAKEAKTAASNAASSASASASSATASQNSASSSASSASTATQKATEASNSATSAAASASTATTKANEAKTSATSASNSAIAAAKSAQLAGTFDPSNYPLKQYTLDLSTLDENTFYPVVFETAYQSVEAEIHSKATSSAEPYNQNALSFRVFAGGFSDGGRQCTIKYYWVFDPKEITIGCLALGRSYGGVCVWLRGGNPSPYLIISTIPPQLFENGWRKGDQVATIGPTYHGAETGNVYVDDAFSPLDIPNNSAKNDHTTYGTFEKAIKDADGRVIKDTYATKWDTYTKTEVDANFAKTSELIDIFYPVGTIYISADKSKTKADFPFMQYGTWEEVPANLCLQTGNASEAGTQRSAGLPNITGKIGSVFYQRTGNGTGAFRTNTETTNDYSGHFDNTVRSGFSFDASLSNHIYGSSDTVQPPAYMVRAWVRTS